MQWLTHTALMGALDTVAVMAAHMELEVEVEVLCTITAAPAVVVVLPVVEVSRHFKEVVIAWEVADESSLQIDVGVTWPSKQNLWRI